MLQFVRPLHGQTQGKSIKVSNVKLEIGTISTDWTPAPEDIDRSLSHLEGAINQFQSTKANKEEVSAIAQRELFSSFNNAAGENLLPNASFKEVRNQFPVGWELYNNIWSQTTSSHIVPGIDNSNAVRLTWAGINTSTKGIYIHHTNSHVFEIGQYYVLAVCARVPEGQPQDGRIVLHYSNTPDWVDRRMLSQPTLSHQWQWTVMVARKPPHANGAYNQWFISVESYTGQSVELCLPYASKGETWMGYKPGDATAKILELSNTIATANNRLSATHTLKTQVISGGRKAIAGIALGASADNQTAESSVIVMADKFSVVKNAQDDSVKPVFDITEDKVAISADIAVKGDLIGNRFVGGEIDVSGNDGVLRVGRTGRFEVRASQHNRGLVMNNDQILVYDQNGRIRLKIGKL